MQASSPPSSRDPSGVSVASSGENGKAREASPPPRSPEQARLHESFKDDRAYLPKMIALDKNKRSTRVDAVLALKGSIDKSSAAILSRNAQADRQVREREEQDAKRFDELLSQGLNPYEVARARNVREAATKERTKIEHRIQEKQVSILKHLEVEKVWMHRQEKIVEEQRAYEKKYQKEMGRAAVEERTKQYLVARTGKETMDPTGKAFRLYPSQETTTKDRSFGLGKNLVHDAQQRHRIVDKVHRKRAHRDAAGAEPTSMLLPRYGETSSNNDAERVSSPATSLASAVAAPMAVTPGQELEELNHSILERDANAKGSTGSLPPLPRTASAGETNAPTKPKKGFGKPHRSVLEQRMLEQARERQKSNIFQKQVVWGKEFTGRAFLADPPEIWFKDFEVGEPMTLTFTLTNVSNTFNHFKLLDLDAAVKEFFEIKFEKPGRMSAGMACRITISFTAIQARDIDTVIPAVAQTGPFSIPLRCTCKKAVPVMESRSLAFRDVVAGEKQVLTLKLENRGALPLEFRVRRVERSRPTHERSVPEVEDDEDALEPEEPGEKGDAGEANEDTRGEELAFAGGTVDMQSTESTAAAANGSDEQKVSTVDGDEPATSNGDEEAQEEDSEDEDKCLVPGGLSNSASGASIGGDISVMTDCVPLSSEEQSILDYARAATVFKPDGADTPIRHTVSGEVAPYSSSSITFTFAPASPMELDDELYLVEFPQATTAYRSAFWTGQLLTPMPLAITAHATRVPIFVAQQELDFRCCLYDRLYRQQLVVCNRGSVALKMQIRVPKALDGCVEFHPSMGFVQGATTASSQDDAANAGKFPVQIKFRPHAEMWKRLEAKSFGSAPLGFIAVPIQIVVPDQVVPVYVILQARLSSATLSFSHKRLDFGTCALGHSAAHLLDITNTSRLPQRFAFVKLPPEIRLENPTTTSNSADDGVATLLPDETKALRVVYLPNASATTLSSRLVCRTTTNDEYSIAVAGECIATPLVFSHTVVQLAATQLGQMQTYSVSCTNNSDKPQTMELVVPPEGKSVLRVTPTVATIPPRGSIRVELEFTASEELFELQMRQYETLESPEAVGSMTSRAHSITVNTSRSEKDRIPANVKAVAATMLKPPVWVGTKGVPAEERSVHHTWSVLCFRQQQSSLVAFQVCTTVVEPKLFATPCELDFGQVAIGQMLMRELTFTNESAHDVLLRSRPLHALGGFRMINSLQRTIASRGGTRRLKMEFRPQSPLVYEDELELSCPELGVLRVALRGEGVNPSLRVTPEDGVIDFKDVLARNRTTSELQLTNASGFPLTLAIVPLPDASAVPMTSSGLPAFTFSPSEATIPAQSTLTVKVLFFPDHQRPQHYYQQYLIQVPNESERHVVSLTGRCWENQLYVFNPHEPPKLFAAPPVEDFFDVPPSVNLSALFGGDASSLLTAALSTPGIKKAPAPLTVVFDSETLASETRTIFVGATLAGDDDTGAQKPGAAAGTFELAIEENPERPHYAKLFTLDPAKGSLSTTQQLPVHITYQRPVAAAGTDGEAAARPELVVSQWIQVRVACTLKGGALWRSVPAPTGSASAGAKGAPVTGESDTRVVHIVLRAKIQT